jgi:hypothetical protein
MGGNMQIVPSIGYIRLLGAVIAAKWAMDLGFSQFRQLLWGFAGLVAAPLVLIILDIRLISQAAESARKWH